MKITIFTLIGMIRLIGSQSLEVSKIKKNKKNFEKFWSPLFIIDDQHFSEFFGFFFFKLQVTVIGFNIQDIQIHVNIQFCHNQ